jgi:hypothetical protein
VAKRGKTYLLALSIASIAFVSLPGTARVIGPFSYKSSRHQSRESQRSILIDAEMVLVDVTVTRPDGSSITGLEKANFHLFEDGVEQEILSFSREDAPISIGLIFDMSGSMSDKVDESRQGALEFLKTANPRDECFLVSFNDRAELTSPFTFDFEELQKSVMSGEPKGHTALLDAIYLGMNQMRGARYSKHALLLISDGGDNYSRYDKAQIRKALKEADCSLYAVVFFRFQDILRSFEEFHGPGCFRNSPKLRAAACFWCRGWRTYLILAPKLEWSYAIDTSSGIDQVMLAVIARGEELRLKLSHPPR